MKNIFKYVIAGVAVIALTTACSQDQLETSPTTAVSGSTMTESSDAAMISLNGIYRSMYTAGWSTTGNTHQCFGISAYNIDAEVMGEDFIMAAVGSGWFYYPCTYDVKDAYTSSSWTSYDLWNAYYTWIANANYLIAMDETLDPLDIDKTYVLGQAYAIRAYSYFMLAQWFARTYKGHENEPCVPIYTEPTSAGTEGQPRATVQEVYNLINADIAKAVEYLERSQNTSITKEKSHITYPVALGLQARIAMTQEDWNTMKTAAEKAISLNEYQIQKVDASTFAVNKSNFINTVASANVMWGATIIADQVGMYASLYTHLDENATYGSRSHKQINKDLYRLLGQNDTRRCWWNPNNAANGNGGYQQDKFHFSSFSTWMGDYVWMRIEEMYLMAAEAECMLGNESEARMYLNTLVQTRDADYNCTATGKELGSLTSDRTGSLREAIIDQRRLELWGEYGRVFDIRRLKQGFVRTTAMGWPNDPAFLLTNRPSTDPENYMWVMTIPQKEFDGNKNLDQDADQNPMGDK